MSRLSFGHLQRPLTPNETFYRQTGIFRCILSHFSDIRKTWSVFPLRKPGIQEEIQIYSGMVAQ
jgi:hypothetical protein